MVSLLLENHAQVDLADKDGFTPLYVAVQQGHTAVVSLLLENHAQVDLADNDGATPLIIAANTGPWPLNR